MNGCNFINYLYSENVWHKYSSVQNTNVMEYGFKNLHNVYIKNTQNKYERIHIYKFHVLVFCGSMSDLKSVLKWCFKSWIKHYKL